MTAGATAGVRAVSLAGSIFLARMLDPTAFGLMALATVVLQTTRLFAGVGMRAAVVRSALDRREVAFHAFLVAAAMGALLCLLMAVSAPALAAALGDYKVVPLLRWMSLVILFDSLSMVPEALLQKDFLFGRRSAAMVLPELLYMAVALPLAALGVGLWSLAYAALARSLFGLLLFWIFCPGWDWLGFTRPNGQIVRSLVGYGAQVTLSGICGFIIATWDSFIVGRVLGATVLGFYSRAFYFASLPINSLEQVVGGVLFASYSTLQADLERLSHAYIRSLRMVSMVTIPSAMGIFVIAPDLVPTLLGAKWLPMVAPLQILCGMCLLALFARSTAPLYLAMGKPGLNTRLAALQCAVLLGTSPILVKAGASGVAVAVTASYAVGFIHNCLVLESVLPGVRAKLPQMLAPLVGAGCVMASVVELTKQPVFYIMGGSDSVLGLLLLVGTGVVTYICVLLTIDRALLVESVRLIKDALAVRRPDAGGSALVATPREQAAAREQISFAPSPGHDGVCASSTST